MKKIIKNLKLQLAGFFAIIFSISFTIMSAIKFNKLNTGYVLGVSSTEDSAKFVASTIYNNNLMQICSGLELLILFVILVAMLCIIYQFVSIIKKLGSDRNFGISNILKIFIFNILIFVLVVVGLANFNMWLIKRVSPMGLLYERISPEIVNITWESRVPTMSQVLWGYSVDHLDSVSLGSNGENKAIDHEVILTVLPNQELYFKVIVNGIKYGETGMNGYYHLGKNSKLDGVYELHLKEAVDKDNR